MAEEIHEFDIGTDLIAFAKDGNQIVDLTLYSNYYFKFLKAKTSTSVTIEADLLTDGEDGGLVYTTVTNFLTPAGDWKWQIYLVSPSGAWHSDVKTFKVHPNL